MSNSTFVYQATDYRLEICCSVKSTNSQVSVTTDIAQQLFLPFILERRIGPIPGNKQTSLNFMDFADRLNWACPAVCLRFKRYRSAFFAHYGGGL